MSEIIRMASVEPVVYGVVKIAWLDGFEAIVDLELAPRAIAAIGGRDLDEVLERRIDDPHRDRAPDIELSRELVEPKADATLRRFEIDRRVLPDHRVAAQIAGVEPGHVELVVGDGRGRGE